MGNKEDKKAKKAVKAAARAQRKLERQERREDRQERRAERQERREERQERREERQQTPTPGPVVAPAATPAFNIPAVSSPTPAPVVRPAAPEPQAARIYDPSLLDKHMDKFKQSNAEVTDLIRHANDSVNRTGWSDKYDDDGTIQWSTSSKKGTPERKQERKTFKQLERETGIDFERARRAARESDIHIKRYGNRDKYFDRKYGDTEWLQNMKNNFGGNPGGLHHYKYRSEKNDYQPYSRVEAPKFKAKLGDGNDRYGKNSQQTLSHEIAHALGLRDLSTPEEQAQAANFSVMGYDSNFKLAGGKNRFGQSDLDAIMKNYNM